MSVDGTLNGAVQIGAFTHSGIVAVGTTYLATAIVTLPEVADGNYRIVVKSDADGVVPEGGRESNNVAVSAGTLALKHPDLVVSSVVIPQNAVSGDEITINWSVKITEPVSRWDRGSTDSICPPMRRLTLATSRSEIFCDRERSWLVTLTTDRRRSGCRSLFRARITSWSRRTLPMPFRRRQAR